MVMGTVIRSVGLAGAGTLLAIGIVLNPVESTAQNGAGGATQNQLREVPAPALPGFESRGDDSRPSLMKIERDDVDEDGVVDVVAYYDVDGDGVVDAEVIDLGATGVADILAIRCDADEDGREDDWAVVDAKTQEIRAALIDSNNDGETDAVSYGNGETEPLPGGETLVRARHFH